MGAKTVTVYHFTSEQHLPRILSDGMLKVTESNLSLKREHAGPDVLWLTSRAELGDADMGLDNPFHDKKAIRFTLELPKREVHKWREWAIRRGIDRRWLDILARAGGSFTWRVIERPVTRSEWVDVLNVRTGERIELVTAQPLSQAQNA